MTLDEIMKNVTSLPWHALKYPDVKTWTVASNASVASKLTEADARFVERAANSFPALVEALQDAITGIEHEQVVMQSFGGPTCSAIMLRALANARAALTTALKDSP